MTELGQQVRAGSVPTSGSSKWDDMVVARGVYEVPSDQEPLGTLRAIWTASRTHLLRTTCNHSRAYVDGDAFCGTCGQQVRPLGPVTGT